MAVSKLPDDPFHRATSSSLLFGYISHTASPFCSTFEASANRGVLKHTSPAPVQSAQNGVSSLSVSGSGFEQKGRSHNSSYNYHYVTSSQKSVAVSA